MDCSNCKTKMRKLPGGHFYCGECKEIFVVKENVLPKLKIGLTNTIVQTRPYLVIYLLIVRVKKRNNAQEIHLISNQVLNVVVINVLKK